MWTFFKPSSETIRALLTRSAGDGFTYAPVGVTRDDPPTTPAGFVLDVNARQLGRGRAAFDAARDAIRRWEMFRLGWVEPANTGAPIVAGTAVAVLARVGPLWSLNACRIVYAIDEPRRFGFAYGTLREHEESGEERFLVEWRDDDSVWYHIRALSRPNRWYVRLGHPLARRMQRRFAVASMDAMERCILTGECLARREDTKR